MIYYLFIQGLVVEQQIFNMATFSLDKFVANPSVAYLQSCQMKKSDWFDIATQYGITFAKSWRKSQVKNAVLNSLVETDVLPEEAFDLCDSESSHLALKQLELRYALEKEERERKERIEREERERRERIEREEREREYEREEKERDRQHQLRLAEMRQRSHGDSDDNDTGVRGFDVSKVSKLLPNFDESEPDEFFMLFEKIAEGLKWPESLWSVIIQVALKGKGRTAYLALTAQECKDYELVKSSVLKAYELTAEYYRVKFRRFKKLDNHSYVEYAHNVTKLHDKWYTAANISDLSEYKELIVLEQFLRGIPNEVRNYLNEREVTTMQRAATLAENYSLINSHHRTKQSRSAPGQGAQSKAGNSIKHEDKICFLCKQPGHFKATCPNKDKSRADSQRNIISLAVGEMSKQGCEVSKGVEPTVESESSFEPFSFNGRVAVSEASDKFVPVRIVRDTLATRSLILKNAVPNYDEVVTGQSMIVQGISGGVVTVPLCRLFLDCGLFSKEVTVGVKDSLIVPNADFLLGNDLAGARVVPDPSVVDSPLEVSSVVDLDKSNSGSGLHPSCVVKHNEETFCDNSVLSVGFSVKPQNTGTQDSVQPHDTGIGFSVEPQNTGTQDSVDPYDTGIVSLIDSREEVRDSSCNLNSETGLVSNVSESVPNHDAGQTGYVLVNNECQNKESESSANVEVGSVNRTDLINAQGRDVTLKPLFDVALTENLMSTEAVCFYLRDGVLMRKYRSLDTPACASWNVYHQIVVPKVYRARVMELAHDRSQAHLGIRKTTNSILRNFYWPGIRNDVKLYCRNCKVCQMVGKPNQVLKPVPLKPIPVMQEPFSKVVIDCVGPLPKTKKQNQYLLTIMCSSTRYPDAYSVRNIRAKTLIPLLVKTFTQYGIPKVVQSDQGTNLTSSLFQEVMKAMGVTHKLSAVYHPQSQGVLERHHQTLKQALSKYCMQNAKDWDEGLPFVLFAIRNAVQESLGFSPAELLYGRELRGPLKVLHDEWLDEEESSVPVSDYVKNLKGKLKDSLKFAHEHLLKAQQKMKDNFDLKSEARSFAPGDSVLFLTPIKKSLEAKYEGPYTVISRDKDNYVIATPGKRRDKKLCHVNSLKLYHEPVKSQVCVVTEVDSVHNLDFEIPNVDVKLKNSDVVNNMSNKLQHLSNDQCEDIKNLIQNFNDLCADVPSRTNFVNFDIDLKPGTEPHKSAPYRVSPQKRSIMKKEVDYLLQNGLAEPSTSPWASPCLLVDKPDGSYRLCTDFRHLNKVTISDSYPLPRIDDLIDEVGKSRFITKIDLLKGYYQIPLSQSARKLCAFVTPDGLFQYTVLPFGVKNAPSVFQRMMDSLIFDLKNVKVYLDDLVVFTDTWEDHMATLRELFRRLRETNLTINLVKTDFGFGTLQYLGFIIGCGHVAPVDSKIEAIQHLPPPSSRRGVQQFLGMVGYYRRFCPNFADISAPLTRLTSSKTKFLWTPACQEAFCKLKSILQCRPVLVSPDVNEPFSLEVDASEIGIGAVLRQRNKDGLLHPVAYLSKKLKPHQQKYSTIEKEALALLMAVEKFEVYLSGSPHIITIYSDHQPLKFIEKMRLKNSRLTRWWLALQPYNLEIKHIKGKDNLLADVLSRNHVNKLVAV